MIFNYLLILLFGVVLSQFLALFIGLLGLELQDRAEKYTNKPKRLTRIYKRIFTFFAYFLNILICVFFTVFCLFCFHNFQLCTVPSDWTYSFFSMVLLLCLVAVPMTSSLFLPRFGASDDDRDEDSHYIYKRGFFGVISCLLLAYILNTNEGFLNINLFLWIKNLIPMMVEFAKEFWLNVYDR